MVHRLGRMEIGEASVAVVATAPHRRPAFEAALEGINRLKKEVPIWKKEFFADGAVWVDGEWDERCAQVSSKNESFKRLLAGMGIALSCLSLAGWAQFKRVNPSA